MRVKSRDEVECLIRLSMLDDLSTAQRYMMRAGRDFATVPVWKFRDLASVVRHLHLLGYTARRVWYFWLRIESVSL